MTQRVERIQHPVRHHHLPIVRSLSMHHGMVLQKVVKKCSSFVRNVSINRTTAVGETFGIDQVYVLFVYADVRIKFEPVTPEVAWPTELVAEQIEVKGNVISCRVPPLPSPIDRSIHVKIIVEQKTRRLGSLAYQYIKQSNQKLSCTMI